MRRTRVFGGGGGGGGAEFIRIYSGNAMVNAAAVISRTHSLVP